LIYHSSVADLDGKPEHVFAILPEAKGRVDWELEDDEAVDDLDGFIVFDDVNPLKARTENKTDMKNLSTQQSEKDGTASSSVHAPTRSRKVVIVDSDVDDVVGDDNEVSEAEEGEEEDIGDEEPVDGADLLNFNEDDEDDDDDEINEYEDDGFVVSDTDDESEISAFTDDLVSECESSELEEHVRDDDSVVEVQKNHGRPNTRRRNNNNGSEQDSNHLSHRVASTTSATNGTNKSSSNKPAKAVKTGQSSTTRTAQASQSTMTIKPPRHDDKPTSTSTSNNPVEAIPATSKSLAEGGSIARQLVATPTPTKDQVLGVAKSVVPASVKPLFARTGPPVTQMNWSSSESEGEEDRSKRSMPQRQLTSPIPQQPLASLVNNQLNPKQSNYLTTLSSSAPAPSQSHTIAQSSDTHDPSIKKEKKKKSKHRGQKRKKADSADNVAWV
jgi:hypothetical protein